MKTCSKCGESKDVSQFRRDYRSRKEIKYRSDCKQCFDASNKECKQRYLNKYPDRRGASLRRYRIRLKADAINGLGGKCECCREDRIEFLSVDHIHGRGKTLKTQTGANSYIVVIKEGFPRDKFRVLCYNCNLSFGFLGYCPHQKGDN